MSAEFIAQASLMVYFNGLKGSSYRRVLMINFQDSSIGFYLRVILRVILKIYTKEIY